MTDDKDLDIEAHAELFENLIENAFGKFDGFVGHIGPREATAWRKVKDLNAELHERRFFQDEPDKFAGEGLCVRIDGTDSSPERGTRFQLAIGPTELMRLALEMAKRDDWFRLELLLELRQATLDEERTLLKEARNE